MKSILTIALILLLPISNLALADGTDSYQYADDGAEMPEPHKSPFRDEQPLEQNKDTDTDNESGPTLVLQEPQVQGPTDEPNETKWQPKTKRPKVVTCRSTPELCDALDEAAFVAAGACSGNCGPFFSDLMSILDDVSHIVDTLHDDPTPVSGEIAGKAWRLARILCRADINVSKSATLRRLNQAIKRSVRRVVWLQEQAGLDRSDIATCRGF